MNVAAAQTMTDASNGLRPVEDLFAEARAAAPARDIASLHTAPWFDDLVAYFDGYPSHALTLPACRAFMYELVRLLRPRFTVEVGTYRAGTTEVMARAVHANGGGLILTIDPFGAERIPGILDTWPQTLRPLVDYMPATSMDLFIQLSRLGSPINLAFIDGNHAYAFAYYDLAAAAKWVAPGGVIVMDDYDQPGVFWAVKHFLDAHPEWQEVSGVFDGYDPAAPFESMRPSVPETKFLVLQRRERFVLGDTTPASFDIASLAEPGLRGFRVSLEPSPAGMLHAKVFLRSFYLDGNQGDPEQVQTVAQGLVAVGSREVEILFDAPLFNSHPLSGTRREVEIVLMWQPAAEGDFLALRAAPHPIPDQQGSQP